MRHNGNYTETERQNHSTQVTQRPTTGEFHAICACLWKGEWRDVEREALEDAKIHRYWEVKSR